MNIHKNASLTPEGRLRMVRRALQPGASATQVAQAFDTTPHTVLKWKKRYQAEGEPGLFDRSSRPHSPHPRSLSSKQIRRIKTLRKRRWTMHRIAREVGCHLSTVSLRLKRMGLNRLAALEPAKPPNRYERAYAGSLVHLDIKKLGRFWRAGHRVTGSRRGTSVGAGWEFVHICIDDHSRISYAEILPNERKENVVGFFRRANAYYASWGIQIEQVMTDNGPGYKSKLFNRLLDAMDITHIFTRPYTPRTNGKAERFIQTALREWAYAVRYRTSHQRGKALWPWIHDYNWHRPHGSLNNKPPGSRIGLDMYNLVRLHN
jgi:transposase InsO family protein